jgi:hypothetical protein
LRIGINVPGNGNINEDQRTVRARGHRFLNVCAMKKSLRTARRSHNDVHAGHRSPAIFKADGAAFELSGELDRAVERPIGHQNGSGPLLRQMADAGLAHLAGADDHHRLPREVVPENLFGQFHNCAPDGRRSAPNAGAAPNFFDDLKGALKDAVQSSTGQLRGACSLIGLLDLAGDFRLAKNHRVHSSSNPK